MAKKKSGNSRRLKGVLILLFILFIAVLGLYKFLKTESGRVFLVDAGFESKFESAQRDLGARILKTLRSYGVQSDRLKSAGESGSGAAHSVVVFHAETPPDASLIQINAAITKAVGEIGGRVHSCREGKDGSIITMEIGTRRTLTHRCVIVKGSERKLAQEAARTTPVVALCVDDFGFFDNPLVKDFLALEIPLTISVIPGLKYSERICKEASEAGKDVICHLPMEAEKEAWDAGEIPLIRVAMSDREIEKTLAKALETTPGVVGISNHMGSKATADRKVMESVLRVCRERNLYFFDSMTTPHSVVRATAVAVGVPSVSNDLFIDNGGSDARDGMRKLLSIARRRGSAVGIVHVKNPSLDDVRWMIDEARRDGVAFVTISELVHRRSLTVAEGEQ